MTDGSNPPPLGPELPQGTPSQAHDDPILGATSLPIASMEDADPKTQILTKGHLHPAVLLLRLIDALRQAAVPLVLGIAINHYFLILALVLFALQLGYALMRYLTLEYTLTSEELRIREGLLHRQERRIPLDRIQDLGFESTILRRALGLAVVMVETASGRGVEAKLDALSRSEAEHLRDVLMSARPASNKTPTDTPGVGDEQTDDDTSQQAHPDVEWTVHRSTTKELLIRGATDMRMSAFAVSGYAAYELANQLGFVTQLAGIAQSFRAWLFGLPPIVFFGVLALLLFVVMAFGIITSTLGNLVQFHAFQIVLRGDILQRRYGLLTTRQKTLPRARVQRVTIEQTWLRRLCGFAVVKADSAGGSRTDGQDTTAGWDVVVPLTRATTAHALLPALLPGIENTGFTWNRGSPKLVLRTAIQGGLLSALAIAAFWWSVGPHSLYALLLIPVWALLGALIWRNLGWARGDDFFALQHGIIGKNFACVPTAKVQAVVIRQGLVGQLLGIADLTVYVAGGSPTRIPDLTLDDARRLCRELSERAAIAATSDW